MSFLFRKLKHYLLVFVVITYLLFEALIWDLIAEPIYEHIKSYKLIHRLNEYIRTKANRYVVFATFVSFFGIAEGMGFISVALLGKGMVILSVIVYLSKVPFAVIAFSVMHEGFDKLNTFFVYRVVYGLIMKIIGKIKATDIYQKTVRKVKEFKAKIVLKTKSKRKTFFAFVKRVFFKYRGEKNEIVG